MDHKRPTSVVNVQKVGSGCVRRSGWGARDCKLAGESINRWMAGSKGRLTNYCDVLLWSQDAQPTGMKVWHEFI